MTKRVTFDFETKSEADLMKVGAQVYSEHPSTDVICAAWVIEDEDAPLYPEPKPKTWWPGKNFNDAMPVALALALLDPATIIVAHNMSFEFFIWLNVMYRRYDWKPPHLSQWRDTMASACYYSLPAKLDTLVWALFKVRKDPEGGRLITKYSKLYLQTCRQHIPDHEWVEWRDMTATEREKNPGSKEAGGFFCEDFKLWVAYCCDDVLLERRVDYFLGPLPEGEAKVYELDKIINRRGLYLDQEGIDNATAIVEERSAELTEEFVRLVGLKPTQLPKLKDWFAAQGLVLENMQKDYLSDILNGEVDLGSGPARRALEIRLAINKASTKKLVAMSRHRGAGGRACWQTRYHGASTGRATGGGIQPLNLNRGYEKLDPEQLVRDISYRDPRFLDQLYGDAMDAVAKASRHWIQAQEGFRILAGDYVSIEAILLAVLAGEEWKVQAFRDGKKIYELMGDKIHGLPEGTVTKDTHPAERQDGKTGELAFGYQGALNAWLNFDKSGRHTDARIIEICKAWRGEHPMVVAFWSGVEIAALRAVETRVRHDFRGIGFEMVDNWLTIILPNGKRLWYWSAYVKLARPHYCMPRTKEKCATDSCNHGLVPKVFYQTVKNGTLIWTTGYGGKWTENVVQAMSRELLMPAIQRVEDAGYPVILSVYDEVVAEVPNDFGSKEEFMGLLAIKPDFAASWPISVEGWQGQRYKK